MTFLSWVSRSKVRIRSIEEERIGANEVNIAVGNWWFFQEVHCIEFDPFFFDGTGTFSGPYLSLRLFDTLRKILKLQVQVWIALAKAHCDSTAAPTNVVDGGTIR